jgi:hypothetical protein
MRLTPGYHLRFQIIPGPNVERDARDLVRFCRRHRVEEVLLFFAAEEWNNGLLSRAEEDLWFTTVAQAKAILEKGGVTVSLNPWMTTLHTDRGRRFPKDRPFAPTVSASGQACKACASFADPAWRRYIENLYGRFAGLGFRVLWVEDDFRFHNHGPLVWGGGFEPEILRLFSRRIGRKVSRAEVVRNILKPGEPHPWRRLWMDTWRDLHLDTARGIARAVARASAGRSTIGCMTSGLSAHSIEGRDWQKFFAAFSIHGRVAHRPHFAGYQESIGAQRWYPVAMLESQKDLRPAGCEVAPEIENFPFTAWSKSDSLTWSDMAISYLQGSHALLLDLFPFSGNPASAEPRVGRLLDQSRPALEWLKTRFPARLESVGVGFPWKEDAQAHVRTAAGKAMTEFNAHPYGPAAFLLSYGVPMSSRIGPVNGLFGSLAWAFSDRELRDLLGRGLLLDGESADILLRRGFGSLIGLASGVWKGREEAPYAVEEVVSRAAGVRPGTFFNANLLPRMFQLEPGPGAEEWSRILTPERRRFGAGMVAFRNRLGGRIVTYAAPNPADLPRCFHRQTMAQAAVRFLAGETFAGVLVTGGPHLMPLHFRDRGRGVVAVLNGSPDPARPVLELAAAPAGRPRATLLAPLARPRPMRVSVVRRGNGVTVRTGRDVPYLGLLVMDWR